jgi:hypothetical protein
MLRLSKTPDLFYWRTVYFTLSTRLGNLEKIERVIYLYQMLFGAKFTPRIVEDLEEISNTYSMDLIYQLFREGYEKKIRSLSWIKTHLKKNSELDTNTV